MFMYYICIRLQDRAGQPLRVPLHLQGRHLQDLHHDRVRQRRRLVRHPGGQRGRGSEQPVAGLRRGEAPHVTASLSIDLDVTRDAPGPGLSAPRDSCLMRWVGVLTVPRPLHSSMT